MKKTTECNWFNRNILDKKKVLEKNLYNWLVLPNNLTETIKKTGAEFSLTLLSQSFDNPYSEENDILAYYSVDASYSLIRRVFLNANNKNMVFSRVIVPEKTYLNYRDELSKLGNSSIGNTLLYIDNEIERKEFEYKLVDCNDEVSQELKNLNHTTIKGFYGARRSVFILKKGSILISEFFLDALPEYPH